MKRLVYLLVMLALPRVYLVDWTNTPSELRENYVTSSSDLLIPTNDGHMVLMADMVRECEEDYDGQEEE